MDLYEFTLVIDREPDDKTIDALFDAGGEDFAVECWKGTGMVHVARRASSLVDAFLSAIRQIESTGVTPIAVRPDDPCR